MAEYIYTMMGVSKTVPPNREIIKDISLSFFPGAKIGVLGLNGAGKSTVLRIMAGIDHEYSGEARPQPGIKIGYLPQEPQLEDDKTVRENVEAGMGDVKELLTEFDAVNMQFAEPMSDDEMNDLLAKQAELQEQIDAANGWDLDRTMNMAAEALRLPPWDAEVKNLSGGEKRRVALCQLLLSAPDMLLLDEPTNHLDLEGVLWLEQFVQQVSMAVVFVTHDRRFLESTATRIVELSKAYPGGAFEVTGNYTEFVKRKDAFLDAQRAAQTSIASKVRRDTAWLNQGIQGRQTRNKTQVAAAADRRDELKATTDRNDAPSQTASFAFKSTDRKTKKLLSLEGVSKSMGEKHLFKSLSITLTPG